MMDMVMANNATVLCLQTGDVACTNAWFRKLASSSSKPVNQSRILGVEGSFIPSFRWWCVNCGGSA